MDVTSSKNAHDGLAHILPEDMYISSGGGANEVILAMLCVNAAAKREHHKTNGSMIQQHVLQSNHQRELQRIECHSKRSRGQLELSLFPQDLTTGRFQVSETGHQAGT